MKRLLLAALTGVLAATLSSCTGESPTSTTHPSGASETGIPREFDIDAGAVHGTPLSFAGLSTGAPPAVPWIDAHRMHVGDRIVTLPTLSPVAEREVIQVVPYGNGSIIEVWARRRWLAFADADGKIVARRYGGALTWSPKHDEVAWWDTTTSEAVIADANTGRELRRVHGPFLSAVPDVAGWLGRGDVVYTAATVTPGVSVWRTSGKNANWLHGAATTSEARGLVATGFQGAAGAETPCGAVYRVKGPWDQRSALWQHCYWRDRVVYGTGLGPFSPDGRTLLAGGFPMTGGWRPFQMVLDADTGSVISRFDQGASGSDRVGATYEVHALTFEGDDHFLAVVSDRTGFKGVTARDAIVRCDVHGGCELATRPVIFNWEREGDPRPYRLVG